MKKSALLVICCLPLLGTSCPSTATSVGLTCSNSLDGSAKFGFKLTVPSKYACSTQPVPSSSLPTGTVVADLYLSGSAYSCTVLVLPHTNPAAGVQTLDNYTNSNGVVFTRYSQTAQGITAQTAVTALKSGLDLFVSIATNGDTSPLVTDLTSIMDSTTLN